MPTVDSGHRPVEGADGKVPRLAGRLHDETVSEPRPHRPARMPRAPAESRPRLARSGGRAPRASRPRLRPAAGSARTRTPAPKSSPRARGARPHAPWATNASAVSTCAGSSRTINRTRTLVSIARMLAPHPGPDPLVHVGYAPGLQRLVEHCLVNIPGRELRGPPNDDFTPALAPFDLRSRRKPKPAADARR